MFNYGTLNKISETVHRYIYLHSKDFANSFTSYLEAHHLASLIKSDFDKDEAPLSPSTGVASIVVDDIGDMSRCACAAEVAAPLIVR